MAPTIPSNYIWTQCAERTMRLRDVGVHLVYDPPKRRGERGRYWYPKWVAAAARWMSVCGVRSSVAYIVIGRAVACDEECAALMRLVEAQDAQGIRDYALGNGAKRG